MCDCNGDGLATLSTFLEREAKKLKIPRCMKLVFFHHGFGVKHKRARQK